MRRSTHSKIRRAKSRRKRVSRKRVSRKRVSRRRVSRKRASRRRLSYKMTGKTYTTLAGATAFPRDPDRTRRYLESEGYNIGLLLNGAIKNNEIKLIQDILGNRSININRDYIRGRNALYDCFIYLAYPSTMIKTLLEYGALADPNDPIIAKAISSLYNPELPLIESLLVAGGNPNIPLKFSEANTLRMFINFFTRGGRYSPLIYVLIIFNDTSIRNTFIKLLLDFGADTNYKTEDGTTVLSLALQLGREPSTIKLLLDAGADPNIRIPDFLLENTAYSRQIKKMLDNHRSKLLVDTMRMIYALRSKDRALTRSPPGDNVRNALDIVTNPDFPEDLRNLILEQAGLKKSHSRGLDALVRKYYAKHRPPTDTWEWDRNKRIELGTKLDRWTKDDDRRTKALVDAGLPLTSRGREKMSRGNSATQAQIEELGQELRPIRLPATLSPFGSDDDSD